MKRTLVLLLGLLSTTGITAQEVMTPELLWELGRVGGGALSPDSKYIVYGVPDTILMRTVAPAICIWQMLNQETTAD